MTDKKDYGYVLPDVVDPSETICFQVYVPDDQFHIAAFMGQLWELTRWYNWAKNDAHTAILVADVWKQIYEQTRTNGACETTLFDIRQQEDEPCIIQKTTDGGDTWVDAVDLQLCPPKIRVNKGIIEWQDENGDWHELDTGDERVDGSAPIPYPANPDGACLTAENITSIYQTALTQIRAGLVASEVAVAIAATITGIMSLFIAPAIIGTIALAITGIALDAGEAGLDAMLDSGHLEEFKCSVYCNTQPDGSITAAGFTAMRTDMATWASGLELQIIQFWLDGFGSVGLTRQATAGGITVADCTCIDCLTIGLTYVTGTGAATVQSGDTVVVGLSPTETPDHYEVAVLFSSCVDVEIVDLDGWVSQIGGAITVNGISRACGAGSWGAGAWADPPVGVVENQEGFDINSLNPDTLITLRVTIH